MTVVYAGTRNLYEMMHTAVTSLLANNDVDKVYLLIEDDDFPYPMPENVEAHNVSNQPYFPDGGANTRNRWTYMALLKVALSKMLTEEKVLWLDCDTIVDDDISELFAMNMGRNWFAGVREYNKCVDGFEYINVGVLLMNLEQIRRDKADDLLITAINREFMELPDQDAINTLSQGKMIFLKSDYNVCPFTKPPEKLKIYHYAARTVWDNDPLYRKYSGKETPIRTLIAVPCMEMVHADFTRSLVELDTVENTSVAIMKNSLIYDARNSICLNAIRHGFDRVLWIDSDMIVPKDAMRILTEDMDKGLDFVTGVYHMKTVPPKPVLYSDIWYRVTENEATAGAATVKSITDGLFEIAGSGFGCVMTSAMLLKKLVDKYGAPFTPMMGLGEDLAFCWRVRQIGEKMYCDGRVSCGHIGSKVFDGCDE